MQNITVQAVEIAHGNIKDWMIHMSESTNKVMAVSKAIRLINGLADARQPLSLQELSSKSGFPKSTSHALLSSMRDEHWIEQTADGKYRLGVRLFELGSLVSQSWDIVRSARPHIQHIASETGEPVQLAAIDHHEVLIIDALDTAGGLRVVTNIGSRLPIYCTALGKAMLAYMPPAQAAGILRPAEMLAYTPHTLTDPEKLVTELAATRERGFALENGEYRIGLRAVAAPIFDVSGTARYAIGVTGMFRRMTGEDFILAQELIDTAARAISAEMGYRK